MKCKKNLLPLLLAAVFFLPQAPLPALEREFPAHGFSADFPEGFMLAEYAEPGRYRFRNAHLPVEFQIACYPAEQFSTADNALLHITAQLGSPEPPAGFSWNGRQAALARLAFPAPGQPENAAPAGQGWAAAAELSGNKGWMTVAAYSFADGSAVSAKGLEAVQLSVLDAISVAGGEKGISPGLVTTFAFPPEGTTEAVCEIGGRTFSVPFDRADGEANQSVTDREFRVLTFYADSSLRDEAWKRFYRQIYRDAWPRMERSARIIGEHLPDSPEQQAKMLAEWLFTFRYERDFAGSDFLSLPEALIRHTGDCDTRALLFLLLLRQNGTDGVLLVSPELRHSVAAIDADFGGPAFSAEGRIFSAVDLTSSKTGGKLREEMADAALWFAVSFPSYPQSIKSW